MGNFAKRRAQEAAAARAAQQVQVVREETEFEDDEGPYRPPRWMYPLVVVADGVRILGSKMRKCMNPHASREDAIYQVEETILAAAVAAPIVQLGANAAIAERYRQDEASRSLDGTIGRPALDGSAASKVRAFQNNEAPMSTKAVQPSSRRNSLSSVSVSSAKASSAGSCEMDPCSPGETATGRWGLASKGSNSSMNGEGIVSSAKSSGKKSSKVAPSPSPSVGKNSPPMAGVRGTPATPRVPAGLPPLTPKTPITSPAKDGMPRNKSVESFLVSSSSEGRLPVNRRLSINKGGRTPVRATAGTPPPPTLTGGSFFSTEGSTIAYSTQDYSADRQGSFGVRALSRVPEKQVERTPVSTVSRGRAAW